MMKNLLLVFLGGGFGSMIRYAISFYMNRELPYGTFAINLLGCLFIGLIIGLVEKTMWSNSHFLLLAIGFCGGFTTFSSFALENYRLINENNFIIALIYIGLSIILGLVCIAIGFKLSKVF